MGGKGQKDGATVSLRLPRAELSALDARARSCGMSRSAYIRFMVSLPIELCEGFGLGPRDAADGRSRTAREGPAEASTAPTAGRRATVMSDRAWRELRLEMTRWGVNYNQGVHAINRCAAAIDEGFARHPKVRDAYLNVLGETSRAFARTEKAMRDVSARVLEIGRDPSRSVAHEALESSRKGPRDDS